MPTSRGKAEAFVKDLGTAVREIQTRLHIDDDDVVVSATVAVTDAVRFSTRDPDED